VSRHLSARARLTLLYTALFALCGGALVTATYLLVAHTLPTTTRATDSAATGSALRQCVESARAAGAAAAAAKQTCSAQYANGVQAGATAQRDAALSHLLTYSLLGLAGATLLAAIMGWFAAGRILAPVHRITAAARAAGEQDLSQRIALQGPRDELRELADTFDSMLEHLDHAFSGQRQFIANASHELRTPLTVMRTAIDVVLAKPHPSTGELVSMAGEVRDAVEDSQRLIDALLILARTGARQLRTEPLDLATIADDALEGRQPAGLTVTVTLLEAPTEGDAVLLERLIGNLLDNAERYNVPHGMVGISTAVDDDAAVLRIVNSGPVISADMVERLFRPFTRLDDRTRHQGSGLGLALVESITAAHSGTIHATPGSTGGLEITVRLPRRPVSPAGGAQG
jgi:signal transduction histidine kinase